MKWTNRFMLVYYQESKPLEVLAEYHNHLLDYCTRAAHLLYEIFGLAV